MAASKLSVSNMALSHTKSATRMSDFDNDSGTLANQIRLFYPTAVKLSLSEFLFSFSSKTVVLAEIAGADIPALYTYALRIPSDFIWAPPVDNVDMKWGADDTGRLVYTNDNTFDYTYNYDISERPFLFTAQMEMAVSYFLASLIAPFTLGVKGNNAQKAVDRLNIYALNWLKQAKSEDANLRGFRKNEDEWPEN